MISPWDRWHSTRCCLCCHVRTGTVILGVWYMLINAVVLLILVTALGDPDQYHLTSAELANDLDDMDDANMCIASAISLLMILISGMATYGAYKQHAAWIIPFFCYQVFDCALNTLVAVSIVVYPNTIQDYLQQLVRRTPKSNSYSNKVPYKELGAILEVANISTLPAPSTLFTPNLTAAPFVCLSDCLVSPSQPENFPYKEDIMAMSNVCLVFIVLLFIGCILTFKAYLIACVWNCYRYVRARSTTEVLIYVTTNDTTVLLPPYDDTMAIPSKNAPPPYGAPYIA